MLDLFQKIPRVCLGSQVVDDSDEEPHPGVVGDIETSCLQTFVSLLPDLHLLLNESSFCES